MNKRGAREAAAFLSSRRFAQLFFCCPEGISTPVGLWCCRRSRNAVEVSQGYESSKGADWSSFKNPTTKHMIAESAVAVERAIVQNGIGLGVCSMELCTSSTSKLIFASEQKQPRCF